MNPDRWREIERLFKEAAALGLEDRARYLDAQCGDDPGLRSEVDALLARDQQPTDTAQEAIGRAARELIDAQHSTLAGRRLGVWRLSEQIARGGMGAVYLAHRADGQFEQRAALKLLNPALMSADASSRFNSERQILAQLAHPNIARLIDGGATDEGVPYLVMEYIDGAPIDEYCNRHGLDLPARLRLFQKVCRAVDYAHKNLIVHRDIKPSNILVDAQGEPWLLDFGVAKLIGGNVNNAATVAELRALTPRYASPEQLKGEIITTATDVYSLGVLLYELLVGRFPYKADATSPTELQRAICEFDPERPSTAVMRKDAASILPLPPARLRKLLAGDVDNIVLAALRKEPERRYASALQLAEDIDRYLEGLPVSARPNRWSYRTGKFIARHKVGVIGSAAVLAAIVGIVAFYTVQLAAQRNTAQLEAAKAREVSRFLVELFREADPNQTPGTELTARVLLDRGAARAGLELQHSPGVRAELMRAIGRSYANMAEFPTALRQVEGALELERTSSDEDARVLWETRLLRGELLSELGRYEEAEAEFEAVHAHNVEQFGPHSREAALSRRALAHLAFVRSEYDEAFAQYQQAIEDLRSAGEDARRELAEALDDFSVIGRDLSKFDESERALRESLGIKLEEYGELHPEVAATYSSLGNVYMSKGDIPAAIDMLRQAIALGRRIFGEDSLRVARYRANLGVAQYHGGQYRESEVESTAALSTFKRVLGPDHPHVVFLTDNIANSMYELGRAAEAWAIYHENVGKLIELFGADHIEVARSRMNEGGALVSLGRHREAIEVLNLALPVFEKLFGRQSVDAARTISKLAEAEDGLGRREAALAKFSEALAIFRKLYGETANTDVARTLSKIAELQLNLGRLGEAQASARASLSMWIELDEENKSRAAAESRAWLGRILLAGGVTDEGLAHLNSAYEWMQAQLGAEDAAAQQLAAEIARVQRGEGARAGEP